MDADGSNQVNLTNSEDFLETDACVSPDGRRILFATTRDDNKEIYVMNIDGSNARRLTNNTAIDERPYWSHDGLEIVYTTGDGYEDEKGVLRGMSCFGDSLYNFGDFGAASLYECPVWAATATVLIVAKHVVLVEGILEDCTVYDAAIDSLNASSNPDVGTAYNIGSYSDYSNPYNVMVDVYRSYDIPQPAPYFPIASWF